MSNAKLFVLLSVLGMLNFIQAASYIGCYIDKGNRDLGKQHISKSTMTQETCIDHCRKYGYEYAGLQHYEHCFCDSSFGKYGKSKESDCSATCKGNEEQVCGGSWRNSMFSTSSDNSGCDPGWKYYDGNCYYFENNKLRSWHEAESDCVNYGSHLVSIVTKEENEFVVRHAIDTTWIGGNDIESEGNFVWVDNSPWSFSTWAPGEPNNNVGEYGGVGHCANLWKDAGYLWDDVSCDAALRYVCKMATRGSRLPSAGWFAPGNGYQYLLLRDHHSWHYSQDLCKKVGANLAHKGMQDLNVRYYIGNVMLSSNFETVYIGLNDAEEGKWKWLDGSSASSNAIWFPHEPNDYGGNEDCAEMVYNPDKFQYYVNDVKCSTYRAALCEKRL